MNISRLLLAAIRGHRGQRLAADASSLRRQTKDDLRANVASGEQTRFRDANRLVSTLLVLLCVGFCAQNAQGQCTSLASGNWNDGTKWSCGHQPTSADGVITVSNGHTMTVTADVTVDQVVVGTSGATTTAITINSGVILTIADGTGTDLSFISRSAVNVNGTLSVLSGASIAGGGGSTGTAPSISVNSGGTLTVAGTLNSSGSGPTNLTVNLGGSASLSGAGSGGLNTIVVGGSLTVGGTYTGGTDVTIQSTGIGTITGSMTGLATMGVSGTLNVNGGTVTANPGASAGFVTVNSAGTLSETGAATVSGNAGNGSVTVTISGTATLAGTSTIASTGASQMQVLSGGTLELGPTATVIGNNFTLQSGGNLKIGSTAGIASSGASGNVQNTGATRSFSTGANYTYNGTAAQVTGNGIPVPVNNLTLDNGAGLTLSKSVTVNGVLALTTGDITTTGSFTLFEVGTSTGNGDVVGNVNRSDVAAGGAAKSFGNPNVQIAQGLLTTGIDITVNLVKAAPVDFTNAVTRTYAITKNGGTLTTATVRLHYLTSELNGNTDDGSLELWRKAGSTWGAEGRTSGVAGSYVELTNVLAFSPWTIAGPSGPTDVAMVNLKATRYDNRVLLEWQTGYEVRNLGFNIYREQKGGYTKINAEPVAGSALLFGPKVSLRAGFAYAWWDKEIADCGSKNADCENARYWIEDLDLSGHSSMHGPFAVERSTSGDAASAGGKETAPLLGAIGSGASRLGASAPVERLAKILKPTAAGLAVQAGVASQQAVKLSVKHEGWYRVEQADLVAAGFPANADALNLQLFVDGQEIPILVTTPTNGGIGSKPTSAPWDGIEFYGIGIDSPFTDSHVYWLVAGSQNGLRINTVPSNGGTPAPAAFPFAVERRDKIVYFPSLHNGGAEKFFGPLIYNAQPVDQSLNLQHIATTGLATLDVSLQGFTDSPHSVTVLLNGSELGAVQFTGLAKGTAQYSIPQTSFLEGSNQLQLISPAGFSDISMVEYVRMTYQHTNTADGNALRFPATAGQQATIAGFTSAAVRVVDITDAASPQEITASVVQDGAEYSVTVTVPGAGARTLLAFAVDQKKAPASLVANQPSSWGSPKNGANYIAVTRKDLLDSFQLLIKQRKNQGLKVSLVDIEDVYDEFSFGNKTPQALKDFFAYTKSSWKIAPRFALLAGDATYDPKNYTGAGDNDVVPTKLVETAFSETATDDWLVDFNGDAVPDIAIGRLPTRTAQESAELAAKIVRYDGSGANRRVVMVADRNDGYDFEAADTQLQSLLPAGLSITDIRRGQVGDPNARTQLLDALNLGAKLVNYYGHGSTLVWTNAPILTAADAASLANTDRLALFDAMTCFNGFFHDVSIDSLGEALLKAPGGAIAVWASSGMTDPAGQVLMNQEAIRQLFSGAGLTIGEVTARAKAATSNADVRRTWILLGDPATKLK